MKRFAVVFAAAVVLALALFAFQNRFIFGIPLVQNGKTKLTEIDHLLGTNYRHVNAWHSRDESWDRIYDVNFACWHLCSILVDFKDDPGVANSALEKRLTVASIRRL
jgi:hypothetical protein